MPNDDIELLRTAIAIAGKAREDGNHPFGALLVAPGEDVVLTAANTVVTHRDVTGHAELNLVRQASALFDADLLARYTLYSSTEPCAMCAGAIYWSGIGRVVYALSEEALYRMTGADPQNPTMRLPVRDVLRAGQRATQVDGPFDLPEATAVHAGFWDPDVRTPRDDHLGRPS